MRWEDERYVRVYTRDTAEWLALGWEGQALLLLLLRKADRAGILQTGKAGVRGVAALAGMPLEVVQRVLPVLMDDGCLRAMDGGGYVFPNFLLAQEARSSDAQRKREQRARDRDKAVAGGASGSVTCLDAEAAMSRSVGRSHGHASHHAVTQGSRSVTDVTYSVTPSRAVPCRAEPSRTQETALSAAADLQAPLLQVAKAPEEQPEDLQSLWNAEAHPSLPRWQGMSDTRKRRAAARLREKPLETWREVIRRLSASTFCRGEEGGTGWRASPDWILQPDVGDKVLEGKYDRPEGAAAARPARADTSAGRGGTQAECAGCGEQGECAGAGQGVLLGYACRCMGAWMGSGLDYTAAAEWARNRRAGRAA